MHENLLYYISVGDSRIYYYHQGTIEIINIPHNYANILRKKRLDGEITQETIDDDPEKEYLTSYLGLERISEIDYNRVPIQLEKGDLGAIAVPMVFSIRSPMKKYMIVLARLNEEPQKAADELIEHTMKKNNEYQDNVTVAIIAKNR